MSTPVVELRAVSHRYGNTVALAPLDLTITTGTTAVLGPNGSGKSTLLRLIATTVGPQQGTVHIEGHDVARPAERTAVRRHLGYATQHDGLPDHMSVAGYLDYVAALKEIGPERRRARWVQWARRQVGLIDPNQRVADMSGGTRRRLTIAQALLGTPRLLVFDEPLAGLDADSRSTVTRLVAACTPTQTVVVATHHADELATLCDHTIVMIEGVVAFSGTPTSLARKAAGMTWETSAALAHPPTSRAVGPGRFRVVSTTPPPEAVAVEPGVQDGYHAVVGTSV